MRCAGVVAAVTKSRSAFPNWLEHLVVLERFKSLWPKGDHITALKDVLLNPEERVVYKAVEILLTIALKDMEWEQQRAQNNKNNSSKFRAFVMGKTRAYFQAGSLEFLEGERLKYLGKYATTLQTIVRGFVTHSKYQNHKHATIVLQSRHQQQTLQKQYHCLRKSTTQIQCWYRIINASCTIVHLRRMFKATMIQTQWRISRDKCRFRTMVAATIVIQTMVRGALQRP